MRTEGAVLRSEVFIPQQQFLIHQPRYACQQTCPIVAFLIRTVYHDRFKRSAKYSDCTPKRVATRCGHLHMFGKTNDAGLVVLMCLTGCKASAPGRIESEIIQSAKEVTIGGKDLQNPLPGTPEVIAEGVKHFRGHCGVCHGNDGQNTGVPFAEKTSPKVADLASKAVQDFTDGQLKWIIENGIRFSGMPSWKGILDDKEMWALVHFIRHLPAKGSAGIPEIYKELEEHEKKEHRH
jgi:hypothetical protein